MARIKITQTRSLIGRPKTQKLVMQSLGLNKINKSVEKEASPSIMGMVNKVKHLVSVTEL